MYASRAQDHDRPVLRFPIATLREEARDPEGDGRRKGREATSKELGGGPEQEKEKGW
jgi:hypothetical protein